jgi:ankyrin repeat protein
MTRRLFLKCLGTVLLLAGSAARAFAIDFPDWYTLANAAAQNKTADVEMMLRRGDDPNFTDDAGRTPLGYAAGFGNTAMLKALLDNRARVDYRDKFGRIPLHWAAELGQVEAIRLLLAAKSPVDATARQGITPLMLAAGSNKGEAVKLLLAAGADPKKQDFTGRDALGWAAGKPAALRVLNAARG